VGKYSQYQDIAAPDDILKLAAQRTGLTEINSDSWRDGLTIILDEVNSSPAFTPFGRERILNDATNALGGACRSTITYSRIPRCLKRPSSGR
jgi:hypothetical protein